MDRRNATSCSPVTIFVASLLCFGATPLRAQWLGYRVPGVPRTADGKVNLSALTPQAPDGKPDLSGFWESETGYFQDLAKDLKPGDVVMQPWAKTLQAQREGKEHQDDPLSVCLPPGVPKIGVTPNPFKILQEPGLVVILYETLGLYRQIFMDGRELQRDPNPTWLGYSTGKWEGDTLVVDTTGFNGKTWLDKIGHPVTEALHVTERFRRRDFGHLEIQATIDDPKAFSKPWTVTEAAELSPGSELMESVCENEKDVKHMTGKEGYSPDGI